MDRGEVDHHGALEYLRRFTAEKGMDPRLDLAELVMEAFRSAHGRPGHAGDRVATATLETVAVRAWAHVDDVRSEVPCPSWCALEAGHPYQDEDRSGNLVRYHSRRYGTPETGVDVSQLETALTPAGPVTLDEAAADIITAGPLDHAACLDVGTALVEAGLMLAGVTAPS